MCHKAAAHPVLSGQEGFVIMEGMGKHFLGTMEKPLWAQHVATGQSIPHILLHVNTLLLLLKKGIFLSHAGFTCPIKKEAPKATGSIRALLQPCPMGVPRANRNCKERLDGNESGRQKGVKTG